MFPSNLNVSLDFVSGNIEILGKQNSLFPSGPDIKCLLCWSMDKFLELSLEEISMANCKEKLSISRPVTRQLTYHDLQDGVSLVLTFLIETLKKQNLGQLRMSTRF